MKQVSIKLNYKYEFKQQTQIQTIKRNLSNYYSNLFTQKSSLKSNSDLITFNHLNAKFILNDADVGIAQKHKWKAMLDPQLKNELMKELSPEDIGKIKKGFDLYKGRVSLKEFICIMLDSLYQKKLQLSHYSKEILTFIELFLLIDLKNLNKIRFQEFTNYLIDRQKSISKTEECHFQPNQQLNKLQLSAEKVFLLRNSQMIGLLENNKKNVALLQKKTYKSIENIAFGGVIINCIIYIPEVKGCKVYCIATNDKFLNFYDSQQNELIRRFILPDPIFHMITFNENSINPKMIAGSTNGHLYQFELKKILAISNKKDKEAARDEEKRKQKYPSQQIYKAFMPDRMEKTDKLIKNDKVQRLFKNDKTEKSQKTDKNDSKVIAVQPDLTCMDIMQPLDLLITGSNDSIVRLYDMRESGLKLAKQLDGHYKGIKGVTVSYKHKVIISCAFDFDILVWNAYLQHPVARLQGHQAPLVNVCCPTKHDIIISLDAKSVMKIWNCQNYQLIQNLVIYENFPQNTSINFLYKIQTDLAIIYTKKLKFFQYIVSYNPRLTDDYDNATVKYSPKNLQIYVGSKRSIKVWSVEKGVQIRMYQDVIENDIAIMQLDFRERRLFLGSIEGDVVAVDVFSGLTIAKYSSHQQEISMLLYNEEHQLLITGGWERKVKIHNDTQQSQPSEKRQNVLRNISNVSEKDLAGGAFSQAELLIATHSKTNYCRIWDFQKGFLEAQLNVPHQITLTYFLSPYPLLIVADTKGSIYMFSTKYYLKKPFSLLTQWKNMYSIQKTSQITFIKFKIIDNHDYLILGDEYGYVRVLDITAFITSQDIKPVTQEMLGNKNPYRIEDYNYRGASQLSVNIHDFSHQESKIIVPPENIKQKLQIKAHDERIIYINLVNQSEEKLLITAGTDKLVKLWNYEGELRGILKQGLKENPSWQYKMNQKWQNKELIQFHKIKGQLETSFDEYLMKKRLAVIPFTEEEVLEEVNNEQIYKDLKEVDGYLSKTEMFRSEAKKTTRRY